MWLVTASTRSWCWASIVSTVAPRASQNATRARTCARSASAGGVTMHQRRWNNEAKPASGPLCSVPATGCAGMIECPGSAAVSVSPMACFEEPTSLTRRVRKLLAVERFARVMHLVSTVDGVLAEGKDAIDAIRSCLNVGTLSGAPKLRAIELIRLVERSPRGPYGGAIGWIAGNGTMDSAVVIRSALVRDGVAEVRAGAGVVADSDPVAEAAETRAKASAVLASLGAAAA